MSLLRSQLGGLVERAGRLRNPGGRTAGIVLWLVAATIYGTVWCRLLGLGDLGVVWHVGVGLAGLTLGWIFVDVLNLPYVVRVQVDYAPVYLVWSGVGTLIVALVVALAQPDANPGGGGRYAR